MSNRMLYFRANSSTEWNAKMDNLLDIHPQGGKLEKKKKNMTKGTVKTGYVQYCIWSPFHVQCNFGPKCKTSREPLIYVIEILGLCIPVLQKWRQWFSIWSSPFNNSVFLVWSYISQQKQWIWKKDSEYTVSKVQDSTTIITTAGRYCLLKNISSKSGLSWGSYFNDYVTKQIPQFT